MREMGGIGNFGIDIFMLIFSLVEGFYSSRYIELVMHVICVVDLKNSKWI